MKLNFHHHGRQFFFLTFGLKGRPPLLSRIVEKSGPSGAQLAASSGARGAAPSVVRSYDVALSPLGEIVIDHWKRQHALNPALTASARVVMPDHCHFLLIVNYDIDPHFDILDWVHHFRRAIEKTWAKTDDGRGHAPRPVWEDAFWLDLSFDARQLAAIRRYIRMNPARAMWKARHPDRFALHARLKYPILPKEATWGGVGDLTLISNPFLFHVRLSRRLSLADHEKTIAEMLKKVQRGFIPVSGFISPAEVELWRRLVAEPNTRMIKTVPYALPPRFDPSVLESQLLSQDRLLILSGFPQTVERGDKIGRENCERMNALAAALCANTAKL